MIHEEIYQGWLGGAGMYSYIPRYMCGTREYPVQSVIYTNREAVTCPECKARVEEILKLADS